MRAPAPLQVKEVRDKKEKGKSRARFWELAGSKMGKVTGGRPPPAPAAGPSCPAPDSTLTLRFKSACRIPSAIHAVLRRSTITSRCRSSCLTENEKPRHRKSATRHACSSVS